MPTPRSQFSSLSIRGGGRELTRREWLARCASVTAMCGGVLAVGQAAQLPPGAGVAATPPCDPSTKPTPARPVAGFRPDAPRRNRLTEAGDTGQVLSLTGAVIGLRCGLISGATVDIWHADANGATQSGLRLHGQQKTDSGGRYRFETIVPGALPGQAPRINLRVTVPRKAMLDTILFLPDAMNKAADARDKAFDELLAMTLVERTTARVTASFNVILDL